MNMKAQTAPNKQYRQIRVFVSSTFQDMHEEREELVKRVFPQLRKLCEQRGVAWGEVDLRWGVSDEQKAEGKVLPICLEEIRRCRPYFIGILGERYGWVLNEIPKELIEEEEWLEDHLHHSVTELEILHGVLKNPEMAEHALFYFRDPKASEKIESNLAKRPDYKPESEESLKKLEALKRRIKEQYPQTETYPDAKKFGELVLRDLTQVINRLYPEGSKPGPLEREAADHEAFAEAKSRVYIGRDEYFQRLDEYVQDEGLPLVVLGDSGSGKSALLANWAIKFRHKNPEVHLLMHFIGSSQYSTDWAAMLRRIIGELKRWFNIGEKIPEKPDELRLAFANILCKVARKGRLVLMLDALNQLEDRDGAANLVWLPPEIPSNVKLILSTLPGKPLEAIKKRGWQTMKIEPLNDDERRVFIKKYLVQYTKSLSFQHSERIVSAPQTANPLFLQTLLEELRMFGKHESLGEKIDFYLQADSIPRLFMKVLGRWEEDYDGDSDLVSNALSLIWASRYGLTESELLDIINSNGKPVPRVQWSIFYLAIENFLTNHSGLLNFSHIYMRDAVYETYLPNQQIQRAAHMRVADYFRKSPLVSLRVADELPWQLVAAGEWKTLRDLMAEAQFFISLWRYKELELKEYWAQLENNSYHKVDTYRFVLDRPEDVEKDFLWYICQLMTDTGHLEEAIALIELLIKHFRREGNLHNLGASVGSLAVIRQRRGELDEAMRLLKEEECICREVDDKDGVQIALGNQGAILRVQGHCDEALRLYEEQEKNSRELGDKSGISIALNNQAGILLELGQPDESMRLLGELERICQEIGDENLRSYSLGNRAAICQVRGQFDDALQLRKEQEQIYRKLGNMEGLQHSLGQQGLIFQERGELDEAMRLQKEKERICQAMGNKIGLSESFGNQGCILCQQGKYDEAMRLHKEQERICREEDIKHGLQQSLGNQGVIFQALGDLDSAMRLHKEKERICRELGNKYELQISLANQAQVLIDTEHHEEALRLLQEREHICRELGKKDGLRQSLSAQASLLLSVGELDAAMELLKESEGICRDITDKKGLQQCLLNQATIFDARMMGKETMRVLKEKELIDRETRDASGTATTLVLQAYTLFKKMGKPHMAKPIAEEANSIIVKNGLTALAEYFKPVLDSIRAYVEKE